MILPATITEDHLEPIQLPDVRQPERMPCWPAWVALRVDLIKTEDLRDRTTRRWRCTPTLPAHLLLTAREREVLERHVTEIESLCAPPPAGDRGAEQEMLAVLTKMMFTLSSTVQSEISAEARGEAFLEALDDLPAWAVRAGVRRWNRGECGLNERGEVYDYHWCPAPAELRRVALAELKRVKMRAHQAQLLLRAECREEYSDEHCCEMRRRLTDLFQRNLRAPLVGSNGSGGVVSAS